MHMNMTSEKVRKGYYYELKENLFDAMASARKATREIIEQLPDKADEYKCVLGGLSAVSIAINKIRGDDLMYGTSCMCYHGGAWKCGMYAENGTVKICDEKGLFTTHMRDAEHVVRLDLFELAKPDFANGTGNDYGTKGAAKAHAQISNKEDE